jgi:hypothetical protein
MQVMTMTSASQFSTKLRVVTGRLLGTLLSITQRRQRRRLLIWDPQTLSPGEPCAVQKKAVAH